MSASGASRRPSDTIDAVKLISYILRGRLEKTKALNAKAIEIPGAGTP